MDDNSIRMQNRQLPVGKLGNKSTRLLFNLVSDLLRVKGNGKIGYRKDAIVIIRDPETGILKEVISEKQIEVNWTHLSPKPDKD